MRANAGVLVAFAFTGVLTAGTWICVRWWPERVAQDFEQCSDDAGTTALSEDQRKSLISQCDERFLGRRKIGGGYTYYDFLQDRHFDIAGPNPTPNDMKYFDEQYALYLDTQRREAEIVTSARRNNEKAQAAFEQNHAANAAPPGPPLVIVPNTVPIPIARNSVVRIKGPCQDSSLSCSWTKFSSRLKSFLQSNASLDRP